MLHSIHRIRKQAIRERITHHEIRHREQIRIVRIVDAIALQRTQIIGVSEFRRGSLRIAANTVGSAPAQRFACRMALQIRRNMVVIEQRVVDIEKKKSLSPSCCNCTGSGLELGLLTRVAAAAGSRGRPRSSLACRAPSAPLAAPGFCRDKAGHWLGCGRARNICVTPFRCANSTSVLATSCPCSTRVSMCRLRAKFRCRSTVSRSSRGHVVQFTSRDYGHGETIGMQIIRDALAAPNQHGASKARASPGSKSGREPRPGSSASS